METADKDPLPVDADEVIGASQSSSQSTEASVTNSQVSEVTDAKQREEDAEMPLAAAEQSGNVEKEAEADSNKEKRVAYVSAKKNEEDAGMTGPSDVAAEKNEEGTKTKEDEPAADSAEAKENGIAGVEAAESDMEMTDGRKDEESKSEGNEATKETPASEENKVDDDEAMEESSQPAAAAPESPNKAPSSLSEKVVTPAKYAAATEAKANEAAEVADAKASDQAADVEDSINQDELSSPRRKKPVESWAETSNGVATPAQPAAKKQKVDGIDANISEKDASDAAKDASSPPLMISRDDMAKMEEDSGRLKFDVITNDGTDEHIIQLTTLKNIFAKQLPKMPKEYIVRLVFDKNHKSMLILKNGTHVIGGICYRPFEKNHFAEIAFCAINASDQVKGYGTRLMNHLKEYVKTKNITHFLTYADNYAIGYFKKQGFTKSVSMARPNWYGYIKDYDGGTLMECTIHTQINYLRITSMIHMQRKAIQDKIRERSKSQTVYPGLTKFAEGRLMDIYMVPGVKEAGWSQAVIRNNRIGTRDQGSLKSQLSQLLKAVSNHRSAWPFHEPVDTSVVVDYLDHIKEPVDLQLISKRIDSGTYLSKATFKADLEKMCDNCMTYNTPDTNYYKAAIDLREFIQSRIQVRDHM
ncbi:hypothetical protein KRP22_005674 [Phytophthora ramorum]|uniref:Histone acetyltransferase GCN5 n=1 Tax=Phytophthora ramorum TaxID=164328 RepID=UPI0030A99AC3|nr:Histone acetyltransferase GCN5 [Phytophthora ramorum]KAH7508102.1 Histone acetyltransferase GCN5 [Phytophthora ramorum]